MKNAIITNILERYATIPPSSPTLLPPAGEGVLLSYSLGMGVARDSILTKLARVNRQKHTPAEKVLWVALRASGLDGWKFRRQMVIDKFIVDFCCPEAKLIVELDGSIHDSREAQIADALRTEYLLAFGYQVIRFHNEHVIQNLPEVLVALRKTLQETQTTTQ